MHCLRHSRNLPAVKSIICGDHGKDSWDAMTIRIPADLAGVQELVIATNRPLQLAFDCACSAGEKLTTFCAVAGEIRADAAALLEMNDALFRRGRTLSLAQAERSIMMAFCSACMYAPILRRSCRTMMPYAL